MKGTAYVQALWHEPYEIYANKSKSRRKSPALAYSFYLESLNKFYWSSFMDWSDSHKNDKHLKPDNFEV